MDDQEEQYLSFIKDDINNIQYVEDQQQRMTCINLVLKDLCHIDDKNVIAEIKSFNEKNRQIRDKIWMITRQVDELNKKTLENYEHMYNDVLLKL